MSRFLDPELLVMALIVALRAFLEVLLSIFVR